MAISFDSGLLNHWALFILLASGIFAAPAYFLLLFLSLRWAGIQTLQIHQVIMDGQELLMSCVSFGVVLDVDILQTVVFCGILDWSAACLCPPHIVWWLWLIHHIYCSCHVWGIWANHRLFPFFPLFIVPQNKNISEQNVHSVLYVSLKGKIKWLCLLVVHFKLDKSNN